MLILVSNFNTGSGQIKVTHRRMPKINLWKSLAAETHTAPLNDASAAGYLAQPGDFAATSTWARVGAAYHVAVVDCGSCSVGVHGGLVVVHGSHSTRPDIASAWQHHERSGAAARTRYVVSDVTHSSQLTPCSLHATATPQTRKAPPIEAPPPKSEISEYWKSFIHHTHGSIVIQQIRYKNNLI